MAGKSPLRRWKPFFPAFGIIDAAIEASVVPALSRDKVRSARDEVVEMLRGVPAADARDSEEFCVLLDGFMAESLLTLRAVPAEAVPRVLASSADLAKAVGALRRHESDRIRGLARDVIRGWTVAVEEDIARTSAAMKRLDDVCRQTTKAAAEASHPKTTNKTAPVAAGHGQRRMENTKDQAPAANRDSRGIPAEKMEVTKRKLHQRYQEVEDAKRQRKIQEIQAPKMPEQRQRNIVHPILRERSQARSGKSTVVRRCAVSSS
ncbi:hypothetical protein HU200_035200 [Digitaria exilis]|uniref:TFIIS N-terminal domain-containing protein n=1 Tax=Digitaria exilis TaxID=1010633 RepID=A0A835EPS3_9POAL|nr:hypothetical protein HU200_035200 [Digitaria exilis]